MKYEKPTLEEIELVLEGSYLAVSTAIKVADGEGGEDGELEYWD